MAGFRCVWILLVAWFMAAAIPRIAQTQPRGSSDPADSQKTTTQLSGRVYDGLVGDETNPLGGVVVELYCSANHAVLGSMIASTTTDPTGWYGLTTEAVCEFFNIVETDPAGYESVGATSVDGEVINPNWIEYAGPVGGLTLTGNKFWDRESDPPPGGWTGFWPTGWVNTRTVTCGIAVSDIGSGLDPTTAAYSTTSDGGSTWSEWLPADCTGSPGSPGPETLTAADAEFTTDAGIDHLTRIRFRVSDLGGNQGNSGEIQIEIDSTAPISTVVELEPCFGVLSIPVVWSADPAGGSPIVSYDVWVEDLLDGTIVAEYEWQSDVAVTSDEFVGEFGHDYTFSSRATDEAGNHEIYPTFPDTSTAIGCDLIVEVRNQSGTLRPNAKVYFNSDYLGSTDGSGAILAPDVMLGDELFALDMIHEEPSLKPHHGTLGNSNWAYKVYLTSFALDAGGTPVLHEVTNLTTTQVLTVRSNQTLVGFHVLVSVEHDAKTAYLDTVRHRLETATDFLYDVGDGQFFFDVVEIRDNSVFRSDSDIKIQASRTKEAWAAPYGIWGPSTRQIRMSRNMNGRTMIHEWGHYGFGLFDEYLNPAGRNTIDSYCSSNLMVPPEERRASIMHDHGKTSEFCSRVDPTHTHRTNTQHDYWTSGETTWETVDRLFTDTPSVPPRWLILTPDERGAVMPGPAAPPANWTTILTVDTDTGSCEPFIVTIRNASGKGEHNADVGLDRHPQPSLFQGWTNPSGGLVIMGAHIGDRLWASSKDGGYASHILTDCTGFTIDLGYPANPFAIDYELAPLDLDLIEIRIRPEIPLVGAPIVNLWQENLPAPIPISLIWDPVPGAFVGQVGLDTERPRAGTVTIEATPTDSTSDIFRATEFRMQEVAAEQHTPRIYAARGDFELVLPADALTDDATIAIQTGAEIGPPPPGLQRLSSAYRVALSTGQQVFQQPSVITIRFDDALVGDTIEGSLDIHWWHPATGAWVSTDADVFLENTLATADITELHAFALMGRSALLFADSFEFGNTSAWSNAGP